MNPVAKVALEKLLGKEKTVILPGAYAIDEEVTLRLRAVVKRSADTEYTPTAEIPLKATLGFLLARMGFQRETAANMLVEAMKDALNAETSGDEKIEALMGDVDAAMARVSTMTAALPKKTRAGQTRVEGTVEVVVLTPVA